MSEAACVGDRSEVTQMPQLDGQRRPCRLGQIWAFVGGCFEIFAGFGSGETAGTRTMFILTGLV